MFLLDEPIAISCCWMHARPYRLMKPGLAEALKSLGVSEPDQLAHKGEKAFSKSPHHGRVAESRSSVTPP